MIQSDFPHVIKRIFICVLLVTAVSPALAAADKQQLHAQDLQRALFADQYQSLNVEGQDVLVVINDNSTAIARGVAILLADNGVGQLSRHGLAPLVSQLNQSGWVTILLPVPDTDFFLPEDNAMTADTAQVNDMADPVEAPSETEQQPVNQNPPSDPATATQDTSTAAVAMPSANPDTSTDTAANNVTATNGLPPFRPVQSVSRVNQQIYQQHLQQLSALMQAASEKASEYQGFILVIAQGTSAASLSQLYAQKVLKAPDAMVVVSPYWPDREVNQQLASYLANTPMPVLDLYSQWDNNWTNASVNARKTAAIKSLKMQYRQRQIIGVALGEQPDEVLNKEIYGWLSRLGW